MKLEFNRPGKSTDNAYIESYNGKFRAECLDQHWFASLQEARRLIERWRIHYNEVRPHSALGHLTPAEFMQAWTEEEHLTEAIL